MKKERTMMHETRLFTMRVILVGMLTVLAVSFVSGQPGFSTISSVHFAVKYQRGITESDARKVADYLESDYTYLTGKLGVSLVKPLEIRVYSSVGKYLEATNQKKPWRAAVFLHNMISMQPVQEVIKNKAFEKSLSYELALAMLDQTSGKGTPRWLREAFAVTHSGIMADLTPAVGTSINSFSDLDQDLQQYATPPQRDDVVFLLGQTYKFLSEKYGEEKAIGVYKAFDGVREIEDIFKAHFGEDFTAMEKQWSAYIAVHSEQFKKKKD